MTQQQDLLPILADLQNALATISGQPGIYTERLGKIISRAGQQIDLLSNTTPPPTTQQETAQQTLHRYATSAAHMQWITQSRLRELTGLSIQDAQTHTHRAAQWPAQHEHALTALLDTLQADTPDHITLSNMIAHHLHPVTISLDAIRTGWRTITTHPHGDLASLNHPTPQLITHVLQEWNIHTPPAAWYWPITT